MCDCQKFGISVLAIQRRGELALTSAVDRTAELAQEGRSGRVLKETASGGGKKGYRRRIGIVVIVVKACGKVKGFQTIRRSAKGSQNAQKNVRSKKEE